MEMLCEPKILSSEDVPVLKIVTEINGDKYHVFYINDQDGAFCCIPALNAICAVDNPDDVFHLAHRLKQSVPAAVAQGVAMAIKKVSGSNEPVPKVTIRSQPWEEILVLSCRAKNCLNRTFMHGSYMKQEIVTIGQVADMDFMSIMRIRNAGEKTRREIATALKNVGIQTSDWLRFLDPPSEQVPTQDHSVLICTTPLQAMSQYLGSSACRDVWRNWSEQEVTNTGCQLMQLEYDLLLSPENVAKLQIALVRDGHLANPYQIISRPMEGKFE